MLPLMKEVSAFCQGNKIAQTDYEPFLSDLDYECYTEEINSFNLPNVTCPCNVACQENTYTSSVTISTWPSNQYWVITCMHNYAIFCQGFIINTM